MKKEDRKHKQKQLVETIGRQYESEGIQPVAGRIIALLMTMDKEEYTFDEIVEELQISKSSASVALKLLQLRETVEYVTHPGDRKRYFRIKTQEPFAMIDHFKEEMTKHRQLLQKVVELKSDAESRNSKFFRDLLDMLEFFLSNFESLKSEYLKSKKNNTQNNNL